MPPPYAIAYQWNQTPAHFALVCALAGVDWQVNRPLRVADLGCGRGHVCHVLAAANPDWTVVGIDHEPGAIAEAQRVAELASLPNVRFLRADLAAGEDLPGLDAQRFDVVMLHGVWTWVSDAVRAGIVRLLASRVEPGGLVYVGYNALPASASDLGLQRLLMSLAGTPSSVARDPVSAAAAAMATLRQIAPHLPLPRTAMLQRLLSDPPALQPAFVAHEFLTPHWRPVFHQSLCADLQPARLSFVGSCNLFEALPHLYARPADRDSGNAIELELWKDLWLPRSFRADVFVRGARAVDPHRALGAVTLAAAAPLPAAFPPLPTGRSEVGLPESVWSRIRARLAQGPGTLNDLRHAAGAQAPELGTLLALLVGQELALPVFGSDLPGPPASVRRLNDVLAQVHAGPGHFALASHAARGGLPASSLDLQLARQRPGSRENVGPSNLAHSERRESMMPVWQTFGVL